MTAAAAQEQEGGGGRQSKQRAAATIRREKENANEICDEIQDSEAGGRPAAEKGERNESCAECKLPLARSTHIVNIGGHPSRWHADCFRCATCREPMDRRQSCHVFRGQVVCRSDYLRLKRDHAVHCARCHWPIAASDWVRRAASYVYHIACFNCDICLRQLNTGEQFIINQAPPAPRSPSGQQTAAAAASTASASAGRALDENEENKVRLLCRLHFNVDTPGELAQDCRTPRGGGASMRQLIAAAELQRSRSPPPPPLLPPLCGDRQAPSQQPKCRKTFNTKQQYSHQVAHKAGHSSAHSSPSPTLRAGDADLDDGESHVVQSASEFAALGDHQPLPVASSSAAVIGTNLSLASGSGSGSSSGSSSASSASSASNSSPSLHAGSYASPMTPTGSSQTSSGLPCKSKRVRTTFTEDQLSILQTHFQIDSNPDGQDLERIATITGLSKRVTQVWFQNSRARQKKYMIKRKPMSGAASLALAASFSNMPGGAGASPLSLGPHQSQQQQQQQHGFRMTSFGEENVFGEAPALGEREQIDCAGPRADQSRGWQVVRQEAARDQAGLPVGKSRALELDEGAAEGDRKRRGLDKGHQEDSRASSSDDDNDDDESDQCSMVMDKEDSRGATTD